MTILLTGCAGFIGWKVAQKLLERGDTVIGVDNLNDYYDPKLKEWRLSTLTPNSNFTFHKEDITDLTAMRELFSSHSFDAVINLAARAGVRASVEDPWIYFKTNVDGTLNLLECCKDDGVKKFVLASTSSLYGWNDIPFHEEKNTDKVLSPYAASKKAAEVLCYTYHYLYKIDVSIPRFFTVYGPGGRPDMSIFIFVKNIFEGKPITVFGDGTQQRDFTYVDDIADGTIKALAPCGYEIFNLGNSTTIALMYVISQIENMLGKKADIHFTPRHPADVLKTWAAITRVSELFDWKPHTGINVGLQKTVDWYFEYHNAVEVIES